MSIFEDNIYRELKKLFPYTKITRQYSVKYKGRQLYFDFYIKAFNLYIECQGDQHYEYSRFFHGTIMNFRDAVYRDELKTEFIEDNKSTLVILDYKDSDITASELLSRIYSKYKSG